MLVHATPIQLGHTIISPMLFLSKLDTNYQQTHVRVMVSPLSSFGELSPVVSAQARSTQARARRLAVALCLGYSARLHTPEPRQYGQYSQHVVTCACDCPLIHHCILSNQHLYVLSHIRCRCV